MYRAFVWQRFEVLDLIFFRGSISHGFKVSIWVCGVDCVLSDIIILLYLIVIIFTEDNVVEAMSKDERIIEIYRSFKTMMRQNGVQISLPIKTDPRKSYGWRYISLFLDKCDKYDLDYGKALEAIIYNAKSHNSLRFGMAILNVSNIATIYKNKLECELQVENRLLKGLRESDSFIRQKISQSKVDILDLLTYRPNPRACANMTSWYQTNEININYMALSRKCMKAFGIIKEKDADQLPLLIELQKNRLICQLDKTSFPKIKLILGDDLIKDNNVH